MPRHTPTPRRLTRTALAGVLIGALALALQTLAGAWHAASHHPLGPIDRYATGTSHDTGDHHRGPADSPSDSRSDCPTCFKILAGAKHLICGDPAPLAIDAPASSDGQSSPDSRLTIEPARTTLARGPPAPSSLAC